MRHKACGCTMRVDLEEGRLYVGMCPECGGFTRERVVIMTNI